MALEGIGVDMTVHELIEMLNGFDPEALVILDNDGNTHDCPKPELWNENDSNSPVALFI